MLPFLWRLFWQLTKGLHPQKLRKLYWHNYICKLNSSEEWKKIVVCGLSGFRVYEEALRVIFQYFWWTSICRGFHQSMKNSNKDSEAVHSLGCYAAEHQNCAGLPWDTRVSLFPRELLISFTPLPSAPVNTARSLILPRASREEEGFKAAERHRSPEHAEDCACLSPAITTTGNFFFPPLLFFFFF